MDHSGILQFTIGRLDQRGLIEARDRQSQLTKPMGSLGQLEDIAVQLAAIQRTSTPTVFPATCLIFAADHPVVKRGVSAFPAAVTPAMVSNIMNGGAASSVLAARLGLPLEIIDVGVENLDTIPASVRCDYHRVRDAAEGLVGDLSAAEAMSPATLSACIQAGIDAVDRAADARLLLLGELGIGNTTVAASVCAHLLGCDPAVMVGRGTGVDDDGLAKKVGAVQSALDATSASTPLEAIEQIGGRDVAAMYGAIARAAEKGIAILVDGYVVAAAALAVIQTYPNAADYILWSHCSQEQGHAVVLRALGAKALLDLELRLGEASGALTAFPIVELACVIHRQMATFAEAAVPNRGD